MNNQLFNSKKYLYKKTFIKSIFIIKNILYILENTNFYNLKSIKKFDLNTWKYLGLLEND